jgi:hypothetical protein
MTRDTLFSLFFSINLLVITLLASSQTVAGLDSDAGDSTIVVLRGTPQFGLVLPHHEEMTYFINDFSYGFDINLGFTNHKSKWYQYANYPEIGIGVFMNSFGNNDVFGQAVSAYGYIQPTVFRSKNFSIRSKLALGIGYVNKPYDKDTNPYNHVFGTNMNVFIGLGFFADYRISDRWLANGNMNFNHLSNGAIKKPNHGINTITMGIGVGYRISKSFDPELDKGIKAPRDNARDFQIYLSGGLSQRSLYKPTNYPSFSLNINHLWWVSKNTGWGLGLDGIYYGSAPYEYLVNNNQFKGEEAYSPMEKMYGSVFGAYNFRFKNTHIFMHIGAYLLYSIEPKQRLYPRLGVHQRIHKNLHGNFSIKASFFKAEFIEFGLGYHINYKKNTL